MIWSVSSTSSAIRRVSRSAITMTSQGQTCVNTPILDALHFSVTDRRRRVVTRHDQRRIPGQRSRLLRAARAGRIGQQYPSEQARAEAIDVGARRPAGVIRADLDRALQECLTAIREHPSQLWDAPGIWLGPGSRPVRGVLPSLRRELEYHHVDLAAGYQPGDWSDDFVATELSRVTALMDRRDDVPPMTLVGHGMLHIGTSPPVDVTGPPAAMLAWLSGRSDGSSLNRPAWPCRRFRHWRSPHCTAPPGPANDGRESSVRARAG